MNQTKVQYENLLVLHNRLCRADVTDLKDIGHQISDVLCFVEKYKLFPVDLSKHFHEQLTLMCDGGSCDLKQEISKELYLYLGRMMYSFEESNIIKMSPYSRLLELNRTQFSYEIANDWGKEFAEKMEFDNELFFFQINRNHISLPSQEDYKAYCNELRKNPTDLNDYFDEEMLLPNALSSEVERIIRESYEKCSEYIDKHYSLIKKAFSIYHKDVRIYIQSRRENVYIVMINVYESLESRITIYPYNVNVMYRFSNVEAVDESLSNSILTYINNSNYSNIKSIFSIAGVHQELNRLFVRYASNADLTDYLVYILRGRLKRVSILNDSEIEVNGEKYLLLFSQIPTMVELQGLLGKYGKKIHCVVFRSRPDESIIDLLKDEGVSFIDVLQLGQSLVNNQNGEMIHWFIKDRLDKIQIDETYKELPIGEILIKRLENCPKGMEGWRQYEDVGSDIFHFLFENTFRHYNYEYQSSTSDSTQRRDLVINNTYKESSSFWKLVKNDYHSNIIVIDFKNYRDALNSDSFYIPTKYLNSVVGNFVIVFSRYGLDDTAKKVQQRLLSEKKLVLCLTDADLVGMINQKMNGQEPLNSLENMYYTMCKNQ